MALHIRIGIYVSTVARNDPTPMKLLGTLAGQRSAKSQKNSESIKAVANSLNGTDIVFICAALF